jgi:hypothetical protein
MAARGGNDADPQAGSAASSHINRRPTEGGNDISGSNALFILGSDARS